MKFTTSKGISFRAQADYTIISIWLSDITVGRNGLRGSQETAATIFIFNFLKKEEEENFK